MSEQVPVANSPGRARAPLFSFPQVMWYVFWIIIILGTMFTLRNPYVLIGSLLIGAAGSLVRHEGPLFLVIPRAIMFKIRYIRNGLVVRRSLTDAQVTYGDHVSALKGGFRIDAEQVILRVQDRGREIPLVRSRGRHSAIVLGESNGRLATADPMDRSTLDASASSVFASLTRVLEVGESIALAQVTRRADPSVSTHFISTRGSDALVVAKPTEEQHERRQRTLGSHAEVLERSWRRRHALVLNGFDPKGWKPRRLHKLTVDQIMKSSAVRGALEAEQSLSRAGADNAHIVSPLEFTSLLRDFQFLGDRIVDDKFKEFYDRADIIRAITSGKADTPKTWTGRFSPFPNRQIEVEHDYILLDGTFHRILWAEQFDFGPMPGGMFDSLFSMHCNYHVSLSAEVRDPEREEKVRNEKRDWRETISGMKRHRSVLDEEEMASEEAGKYTTFYSAGKPIHWRLLLAGSGSSYEEMEDSCAMIRDESKGLPLSLDTINDGDQLPWFWASLGTLY